ncbi:MAG: TrkH family potassium uptake protein, partial [Dysgonamonadaceae bacterium]|nr:TrkH family potassium uptake protein [Dysgonamonadaceae bacterium]
MQNWRFNWKFIGRITGAILVFESLFMFISAGIATYFQGTDARSFVASAFITLICGACIILPTGFERIKIIGKRESYLAVTLSWLLFALFGALPFFLSGEVPSFTNAFFESTSGITTTGASILTNIDSMSKGLLFWRSLMQWLGGMGIIVFSLALLPILGGEASLLFDAEASGLTHDRFRPRVAEMAKRLWAIYLGFTVILIVLLLLGPMGKFDALCHSFTTVSTGGFSTKQLSIT